ncbi:MAG: hypothetical protein ACI8PB_000238 [Desulforhopalus sp.]|jgi:hypothetical protein
MKRIIASLIIVSLWVTVAQADWLSDFSQTFKTKNLDVAVDNAVKQGITPDAIVENCLGIKTVNPQNVVKALYCSGVSGQDIYTATQAYGVSELIVSAGFNKSIEECGDRVTDTQAYTPGGRQGRGFGGANRGQRGKPNVSPSTP